MYSSLVNRCSVLKINKNSIEKIFDDGFNEFKKGYLRRDHIIKSFV